MWLLLFMSNSSVRWLLEIQLFLILLKVTTDHLVTSKSEIFYLGYVKMFLQKIFEYIKTRKHTLSGLIFVFKIFDKTNLKSFVLRYFNKYFLGDGYKSIGLRKRNLFSKWRNSSSEIGTKNCNQKFISFLNADLMSRVVVNSFLSISFT